MRLPHPRFSSSDCLLVRVSRFFRETTPYEELTGSNSYSGDTFAAPVSILVRWNVGNELVRNSEGREITTSGDFSTLTAVKLGSRVTDPSGTQRRIVQVRTNRDTRGRLSHYRAWVA